MGERPKKKKKVYVTIGIDTNTRDEFFVWCEDRGVTYDTAIKNLIKQK